MKIISDNQQELFDWIGLIMQIPLKPAYHRVKIWRRLNELGALHLKNALYILPKREETIEDFQWLKREIENLKGEAILIDFLLLEGISNDKLKELFSLARQRDYLPLIKSIKQAMSHELNSRTKFQKLQRKFETIKQIDFFEAAEKEITFMLLKQWEEKMYKTPEKNKLRQAKKLPSLPGNSIWVTSSSIGVDRMASAWLIKHFMDAQAKFKFVPNRDYKPRKNEIPFDMYEGEFSHQGDKCTFEILVEHFQLKDRALKKMSYIIHDLDFKDSKFNLGETEGVKALIEGIKKTYQDDLHRLEHSTHLFNHLYTSYKKAMK